MDSSTDNEMKDNMKRTYLISALTFILAAFMLHGCYKVSPHGYTELAPITINASSDTINVNLGTELVYNGLDIVSSKEISYQWAYGQVKTGTTPEQHQFEKMEVISTSRTIDYTFSKVGSFLLRLRVDNGESIEFKYFTLNVNSGYDEGIAILSNDENGNGSLTFVKTLTAEETAKGEQQVFNNIFSVDGKVLKNGTSLYISDNTYSGITYSGFLIATNDEDGTIYHMDCKTFELYMTAKMKDTGTYCAEFGGEYAEDKASFGCFFRSADGRLFRYDMNGGFVSEITDAPFKIDRIFDGTTKSTAATAKSTRYPLFYDQNTIGIRKSASAGIRTNAEEGWEIVNVGVQRVSSNAYIHVLFRSKSDPTSYKTKVTSSSLTQWATKTEEIDGESVKTDVEYPFTTSNLQMDSHSKILGNRISSDVYYTYDNAIYRWSLTSAPGSKPAIKLPAGEQIRDIATNFKGRKASDGEDKLYVVTYNPSRSGEHKGSLYVYRYSDDTLTASYEGICDDPACVIYKYRIN